jgi:hypothetical protein
VAGQSRRRKRSASRLGLDLGGLVGIVATEEKGVRSPGGGENDGADATQHQAGWVAIRRALALVHDTASISSCFVAAVAILWNWYP